MWKTEIEVVTRQNSHLHRDELAKLLFNHLNQMYTGTSWIAIIYDDVTGSQYHNMKGFDYHYIFRHYGNNVVVFRLVYPRDKDEVNDLGGKFLKAYEPHFDGSHIDAEKTVASTWANLPREGVAPWNLFMIRSGIACSTYGHVTSRMLTTNLPSDQGLSVIMGEKH